jgi:hypothetical protein
VCPKNHNLLCYAAVVLGQLQNESISSYSMSRASAGAFPLGTQLTQHSHCYPHYTDTSVRVLFTTDLACEIQIEFVWHMSRGKVDHHETRSQRNRRVFDSVRTTQWEGHRAGVTSARPRARRPPSREFVTRLPKIYGAVGTLAKTREVPRSD